MIVKLLACTTIVPGARDFLARSGVEVTDSDHLAEIAGRECYQSRHRPNPRTAYNAGYLANILRQEHESVLEHASITVRVTGVSRSFLAELSRHRHLSLSVQSQRYVDESDARFVNPPAAQRYVQTPRVAAAWRDAHALHANALECYTELADALIESGLKRKRAREAARSVLLTGTETRMVVSGNIRAWRYVITKRYHIAADHEIEEFAGRVLDILRTVAPSSVQDMSGCPFGTEEQS